MLSVNGLTHGVGTYFLKNPAARHGHSVEATPLFSKFGTEVYIQDLVQSQGDREVKASKLYLNGNEVTTLSGRFNTTFEEYKKNCMDSGEFSAFDVLAEKTVNNGGFALSSEYLMAQLVTVMLEENGFRVVDVVGELDVVTLGLKGGVAHGTDSAFRVSRDGIESLYSLQVTCFIKETYSHASVQSKVIAKMMSAVNAAQSMNSDIGVKGRVSKADIRLVPVHGAMIAFVVRNAAVAKMTRDAILAVMRKNGVYRQLKISCVILIAFQLSPTSFMYFSQHSAVKTGRRRGRKNSSSRQGHPVRQRSRTRSRTLSDWIPEYSPSVAG